MVGATGFEPATTGPPGPSATALHQVDVATAVEALAGGILLGPQQLELRLPVAEDVGGDARDLLHFPDAVVQLLRDLQRHGALVRAGRGVDPLLETLAGLEREDLARRDLDGVTRLGIAAPPRRLAADAEVAEADDLDVLALLEAAEDDVEDRLDHRRGLALAQSVRGNGVDQIVLGHGGDSPPRRDGYGPPRAMNGL